MIVIMIMMLPQMIIAMDPEDDSKSFKMRYESSFVRLGVDNKCVQKGVPPLITPKTSCTQPRVGAVDGNLKSTSCPHIFLHGEPKQRQVLAHMPLCNNLTLLQNKQD